MQTPTRTNDNLTVYRIIFWIDTLLLIASITVAFIAGFVEDSFGPFRTYAFGFSVVFAVIYLVGFTLTIKAARDQKEFFRQLKLENVYALGATSNFYDIHAFKNRVNKLHLSRKNAKKNQYLIAFTISNIKTASNSFHNEQVTNLNHIISQHIEQKFVGRNEYSLKDNVYGFNHGVFLIYTCNNDEKFILNLIDDLTTFIYKTADETGVHIFIRPFFGVKEIKPEETIAGAIEDTLTARNTSENTFSNYTYFDDKEKIIDSNDDLLSIKNALDNGEFVPYYQLKYSLKEKKFVSAEALARWNHPTRGLLGPNQFIDKAERGGFLSAIDAYIFEAALKDIQSSIKKGRRVIPISVNFSLYEFFSHEFLTKFIAMLDKYQVPPSLVEIEITETTSQVNKFLSVSVIKKLKEIGVRVLMDDFGVGYSGLETLRAIPFDAIKIDKSFVDHMFDDDKTKSIIKFLIELGHTNKIEVITEGVETKEQVEALRRMRVDTIQGFYYSRPLSYSNMEEMLKNNEFEGRKKR